MRNARAAMRLAPTTGGPRPAGARWRRSIGERGFVRIPWLLLSVVLALVPASWVQPARAQEASAPLGAPARRANFGWNTNQSELYAWVSYRDSIDSEIQVKLRRGLPTTIVLTALVYVVGQEEPVATTIQSCKSTWHVWEEMYRVELTRPNDGGKVQRHWTPTVNGVLRRCAEARGLLIASRGQVPPGASVWLGATVQVNPVSKEVFQKIKRWISRPSRTATASPGGALFSTFTGLFMARIGEAERVFPFRTLAAVPRRLGPLTN